MNEDNKCPECSKQCKSKAGLTMYMNGMHLILSPSQLEQKGKYDIKKELKIDEKILPKI